MGVHLMTRSIFIIALFFSFTISLCFWPTIFRYEKMKIGGDEFPIRINRITGEAQVWALNKWAAQTSPNEPETLSEAERSKITGNGSLEYGFFQGKIYNGSDFDVTSLEIRVNLTALGSIDEVKNDSITSLLEYSSSNFLELSASEKEEFVNLILKQPDEDLLAFVIALIPDYEKLPNEKKEQFQQEIWEACKSNKIKQLWQKLELKLAKASWSRIFSITKEFKSFSTTEFTISAATDSSEKPLKTSWEIIGAKGHQKNK